MHYASAYQPPSSHDCKVALSGLHSILDGNNVGFVIQHPFHIPLLPWLSALQAVGLGIRNINRKLVLATHIVFVKYAWNSRGRRCCMGAEYGGEREGISVFALARFLVPLISR